jgi:predicted transcriptional regulator of viral defense system
MAKIDHIIEILNERHLLRTVALDLRVVRELVAEGVALRAVPGVIATPSAAADQDIDLAVVALLTDGVICGLSAGLKHGLVDAPPRATQVLVPNAVTRSVPGIPVDLWRVRRPENLTVGVDPTFPTYSGMTFPITGPARTVVDLYRRRFLGDRQHALAALTTYFIQGNPPDHLPEIAREFGIWDRMRPEFDVAVEMTDRGMRP